VGPNLAYWVSHKAPFWECPPPKGFTLGMKLALLKVTSILGPSFELIQTLDQILCAIYMYNVFIVKNFFSSISRILKKKAMIQISPKLHFHA
jgi:hypothetical protein